LRFNCTQLSHNIRFLPHQTPSPGVKGRGINSVFHFKPLKALGD